MADFWVDEPVKIRTAAEEQEAMKEAIALEGRINQETNQSFIKGLEREDLSLRDLFLIMREAAKDGKATARKDNKQSASGSQIAGLLESLMQTDGNGQPLPIANGQTTEQLLRQAILSVRDGAAPQRDPNNPMNTVPSQFTRADLEQFRKLSAKAMEAHGWDFSHEIAFRANHPMCRKVPDASRLVQFETASDAERFLKGNQFGIDDQGDSDRSNPDYTFWDAIGARSVGDGTWRLGDGSLREAGFVTDQQHGSPRVVDAIGSVLDPADVIQGDYGSWGKVGDFVDQTYDPTVSDQSTGFGSPQHEVNQYRSVKVNDQDVTGTHTGHRTYSNENYVYEHTDTSGVGNIHIDNIHQRDGDEAIHVDIDDEQGIYDVRGEVNVSRT